MNLEHCWKNSPLTSSINLYLDRRTFLEKYTPTKVLTQTPQTKKCSKIALIICQSNFHAIYFKFKRRLEEEPNFFKK